MSEEELQEKMKQILEDHKNIINVTAEETTSELVSSEASE
jgi:hypothetical protein